jgi:hypothetical protein
MAPVAVDPQKGAKMLAQLRRGFHNDGLVVQPHFRSLSSVVNLRRGMPR